MVLHLAKPDLIHFEQFNDMMEEWVASGTQIAPWFLSRPAGSLEEFAGLIRMLDDGEHGRVDGPYAANTAYFALDEAGELVGAANLRHYLTPEGLRTWGHIGYGVRPSRRRQGCATQILRLALAEARNRKLDRVLLGAHGSNIGSCKVIEACGGILEDVRPDPEDPEETIRRYWITT